MGINGKDVPIRKVMNGWHSWYNTRRLVALPKVPSFQEPLYGYHPIQPSETSHAVGYVEPEEGMSVGTTLAAGSATVLIGFALIYYLRSRLLKRFRSIYDDGG